LAKLQASNIEDLRSGLSFQIRKINNVTGTLTLMGIEGQDKISKWFSENESNKTRYTFGSKKRPKLLNR